MHIYIYIYMYIYTYIYISLRRLDGQHVGGPRPYAINIRIYLHKYTYACTYAHIHQPETPRWIACGGPLRPYKHKNAHMYTLICVFMYIYINIYIADLCIYGRKGPPHIPYPSRRLRLVYMCICPYRCIFMYIYGHIYVYICVYVVAVGPTANTYTNIYT